MTQYKKVLLVDDDEDDRAFFLEALKGLDQNVVCVIAQNGKEALETLLADHPKPDIIFLDLNMPLMNGREFLSVTRNYEQIRRIPIIILTTSSDENVKLETAKLGARGFITKPDRFHLWESTINGFFKDTNLKSEG
jgi:CheY-like chemotaxis protein